MTRQFFLLLFILFLPFISNYTFGQYRGSSVEKGQVIINDSTFVPGNYKECFLKGISGGSGSFLPEGLKMSMSDPGNAFGYIAKSTVTGHFYAEAKFDSDKGFGLALIKENKGSPDFNNWTSLCVTTENGLVWVSVVDRQKGDDNVFDYRHQAPADKYRYALTEDNYSVNVTGTNRKIRIFHDDLSNTWHFYYNIKKLIKGVYKEGWLEMKPSPDWNPVGSKFYVCPYVINAGSGSGPVSAVCSHLRVINKPMEDQDDNLTGFKVIRREMTWAGFSGEAAVITFGDHFPYNNPKPKFAFWSEANYVPGWYMHNQLQTMYEFVEQGLSPTGCEEPMSDRLLRHSNVEIIEDNAVRKTIHWHYVDNNPEYKTVEENIGTQMPEIDEYYTFYPDGVGIRKINFRPKTDGTEYGWYELSEMHVTAGSKTIPAEHLGSPALSLANLQGDVHNFFPTETPVNKETYKKWDQIMSIIHCKGAPDPFIVFSHSPDIPETYSHHKITVSQYPKWQNPDVQLTHFPVNKEKYDNKDASNATWPGTMVSRTSLACLAIREENDLWNDYFKIDNTGRKYREWFALVGLAPNGQISQVKYLTESWLYPGTIKMLGRNCTFEKNDVSLRQLIFNRKSGNACKFIIDPVLNGTNIVNPVFFIKNWDSGLCNVILNGKKLMPGKNFEYALISSDILVWIKTQSGTALKFEINQTEGS